MTSRRASFASPARKPTRPAPRNSRGGKARLTGPNVTILRPIALAALLVAAIGWLLTTPALRRLISPRTAPTRILVILDTVRWDYTSLCGFDKPTTPTLDLLASLPNAQYTCRAYTPGAWTLPTHASFFTGLPVLEHGAHFVPGHLLETPKLAARGLPEHIPTLAETLRDQGYQTVAISGNPVVGPESGLDRGFEIMRTG